MTYLVRIYTGSKERQAHSNANCNFKKIFSVDVNELRAFGFDFHSQLIHKYTLKKT